MLTFYKVEEVLKCWHFTRLRCLRKLTEGGAVVENAFGFPKLSSLAPSYFQQCNLHFSQTFCHYYLYPWWLPQDFEVWDKVWACGGIEEVVRKSERHLISRKFVLAQTATITIWELSQNPGTKILRTFAFFQFYNKFLFWKWWIVEKGKWLYI